MTHVDVLGYREWAARAFELAGELIMLRRSMPGTAVYHKLHYREHADLVCKDAELVFLVGWSKIVEPDFYRDRMVLVVHPSKLPEYRGGSPIQHQIIAGMEESAVSIFRLDDEHPAVDSGPLCFQYEYSLVGPLDRVLGEIASVSAMGIEGMIEQYPNVHFWEQGQGQSGVFKRRTPEQSEIPLAELALLPARALYDKIRALQDPYPNAFIVAGDGQRLYITQAHLEEGRDGIEAGDSTAR